MDEEFDESGEEGDEEEEEGAWRAPAAKVVAPGTRLYGYSDEDTLPFFAVIKTIDTDPPHLKRDASAATTYTLQIVCASDDGKHGLWHYPETWNEHYKHGSVRAHRNKYAVNLSIVDTNRYVEDMSSTERLRTRWTPYEAP